MSRALVKVVRNQKPPPGDHPGMSAEERRALHLLRVEAQAAGAKLANGGRGGLPCSLVLHVMRRDHFTCALHGDHGEGKYGGLTVHHRGGIITSQRMIELGHRNLPENLATVCSQAHDWMHDEARREGIDADQVTGAEYQK